MARIFPFQPYRYTQAAAVALDHLVTQPYDKIYPDMRERYLSLSPYNLVRIILGKPQPTDSASDNIYTRGAAHLNDWIAKGVLAREAEPSFFAYFQEFRDPDSGETLVRKGFIGLGQVEEYSAGIVHRHEQTLSGPKKDRLEVLRHTHAHFGQIFMLYPDKEGAVDRILDAAAAQAPLGVVTDEYNGVHRLWKISDPATVAEVQRLMGDKKLVIADGHHRYETALNFSKESSLADAQRVMMTFVNMYSPGLRILATHRLVKNLDGFEAQAMLEKLGTLGTLAPIDEAAFRQRFASFEDGKVLMGVALPDGIRLLEAPRAKGDLDVRFLHQRVLEGVLGIGEEAVREEKYLQYVRGLDGALAAVRGGKAQVGFLLQPTRIDEVADVSFGGGVMPQKSTDFYPKLLSGMTIYRLEQ
ncbi:MAG: DUF1015 domain-containing protein [Bryobacteraceae bacterium]